MSAAGENQFSCRVHLNRRWVCIRQLPDDCSLKKGRNMRRIIVVSLILLVVGLSAKADESLPSSAALKRHQDAVTEIEQLGGKYYPNFVGWATRPNHLNLLKWKGTNYGQLSHLISLQMVWLPSTITDNDLEEINLPDLLFVRFSGGTYTDDGFADFIARHPKLIRVTLVAAPQLTDAGLASLGQLKHLEDIEMIQVSLTNDGVRQLPKNLKMLSLRRSNVTAKCVSDIAEMKNMQFLYLVDVPRINDNDVQTLSTLKKLKALNIEDAELTNKGLGHLAKLTSLEALSFGGSTIADKDLTQLQTLTNLNRLFPHNTKCTQAGLDRLRDTIWPSEEEAQKNRVLFLPMNSK